MVDPLSVGMDALANELYELRCDLDLSEWGERMYTTAQLEAMRSRVAELEPIVGAHLQQMLERDDFAGATE